MRYQTQSKSFLFYVVWRGYNWRKNEKKNLYLVSSTFLLYFGRLYTAVERFRASPWYDSFRCFGEKNRFESDGCSIILAGPLFKNFTGIQTLIWATLIWNFSQTRGGSRIFSRGGADFQKNFKIFVDLFLFFSWSTQLIFWALPKHFLVPVLAEISAPQAKFWKNRPKRCF